MATLSGFIQGLLDYLQSFEENPAAYIITFYVFCVLAAVILPIPIETAIVLHPSSVPDPVIAVVTGLGKGTGAMAVFFIGGQIDKVILRFAKWGWFKWLLDKSEAFVRRFGYFAIYAIMSIPLMPDTIPLYIFSILNREGKIMRLRWFTVANVFAGITRATIVLVFLREFFA